MVNGKAISVPATWHEQRVFLIIGASDYKTTVWLDGKELGSHEGGYTPFEFELPTVKAGVKPKLVIRVDDKRRDYALYGKQGYGNARGIWQTIYLEARPPQYFETIHFTPDIDNKIVKVEATLPSAAKQNLNVFIKIGASNTTKSINKVKNKSLLMCRCPTPNCGL